MRKAGVRSGSSMLLNGISGTLGIGGALFGLGMGATRILGTARNRQLLDPGEGSVAAPDRGAPQRDAGAPIEDGVVKLNRGNHC
jgi:hypothetical protein